MLASSRTSPERDSGSGKRECQKAGSLSHKHVELAAGEDTWAAGIRLSSYSSNQISKHDGLNPELEIS